MTGELITGELMTTYAVVLTTVGSQHEAEAIAAALVEANLAAYVSLSPVHSIYTWQGKLQNEREWQLAIKTRLDCFDELSDKVKALHSYDTPELIALPIVAGSTDYLSWLGADVKEPPI